MTEEDSIPKLRRNLLIVGVLLFAKELDLLTINKDATIFNEAITVNSQVFQIWILILFFYSWWRYWSSKGSPLGAVMYFLDEPCRKKVRAGVANYAQKICAHLLKISDQVLDPAFQLPNGMAASLLIRASGKSFPNKKEKAYLERERITYTHPSNGETVLTIHAPKTLTARLWAFALIRSVFDDETFSEDVFPHLFAIGVIFEVLRNDSHFAWLRFLGDISRHGSN